MDPGHVSKVGHHSLTCLFLLALSTACGTPAGLHPELARGPKPKPPPVVDTIPDGRFPYGAFTASKTCSGSTTYPTTNLVGSSLTLSTLSELGGCKRRAFIVPAGPGPCFVSGYNTDNPRFSLDAWKACVGRYASLDFAPFIADGTLLFHMLIDEPNSVKRYGPITRSELAAMATYSKSLWPALPTAMRVRCTWLDDGTTYPDLDACWAQYLPARGDVTAFRDQEIAAAKRLSLALIIGLKVYYDAGTGMSPSDIKAYGAVMMATDYECAFINWKADATYESKSGVTDALRALRNLVMAQPVKSCGRG